MRYLLRRRARPEPMHTIAAIRALCLSLLIGCVVAGTALAADVGAATGGQDIEQTAAGITLNLRETDVQSLIAAVADLTGKNFVVDPRVKGKVTLYSATPTGPEALYDVFVSVLKVYGFAVIDTGDVIKIVPDEMSRQMSTIDDRTAGGDRITSAVIPVTHAVAAELVASLRPLLPQQAHLAAVAGGNMLLVSDSAANVRRLVDLVRQIDRPQQLDVKLLEMRYAQATDVAEALIAASGGGAALTAPGAPVVLADERTNRLLIGGTMVQREHLGALAAKLDQPARASDGSIDVVFLRFAEASAMVEILQAVGERVGSGSGEPKPRRAPTGAETFLVHADESTNAIVIQAKPQLMQVIKDVITKLDVRRAQVLVEGIIAEVSSTKSDELGIQWKTNVPGTGLFAGNLQGGVGAGPIPSPFDDLGGPSLLSGLTLGYFSQGDLRALIRALSGDSYTNVLSTPTLVTLDNAEAEIVVGQNVPFITGQFTNNSTTPDNPFQTIERQDVGIVLKVKPQINEGNSVTLEIEQEVSSVARESTGADLITNKRSIRTNVLVDDRNIVVLGGLISDDKRESRQKIPLLGEIPLLGQFFRNDQGESVKTNLMVFLRPTIIRDAATSRELVRSRYEDIRSKQIAQERESRFLLHEDGAELPTIEGLLE